MPNGTRHQKRVLGPESRQKIAEARRKQCATQNRRAKYTSPRAFPRYEPTYLNQRGGPSLALTPYDLRVTSMESVTPMPVILAITRGREPGYSG